MIRNLMLVLTLVAAATLVGLPAASLAQDAAEAPPQAQAKDSGALKAVKASLALLDQGKYAEMWEAAAPYFKNAVPKETWTQQASAVREPLGALVSRDVLGSNHYSSLPGAPDGDYVVFQFDTVFENKSEAVETVTVKRDDQGTYRLSGYYIK